MSDWRYMLMIIACTSLSGCGDEAVPEPVDVESADLSTVDWTAVEILSKSTPQHPLQPASAPSPIPKPAPISKPGPIPESSTAKTGTESASSPLMQTGIQVSTNENAWLSDQQCLQWSRSASNRWKEKWILLRLAAVQDCLRVISAAELKRVYEVQAQTLDARRLTNDLSDLQRARLLLKNEQIALERAIREVRGEFADERGRPLE